MEKKTDTTETQVAIRTTPASLITPELAKVIEDESIHGLNGGMLVFMRKRGMDYSNEQAVKFADLITAEFGPKESADTYPLSKSMAKPIRAALDESLDTFVCLHKAGEEENLRKLIRVIVAGEMMIVLQECLEEAMKAYNAIK